MKTIEVTDIGKYLDAAPSKMCCMFIGDTGVGKTQCITNWAKEKGYFLKSLVLSQLEASETLGIPVQSKRIYDGVEYNTIDIAIPAWVFELAEHQDTGAVLYLDEFLCSEPAVMNSFLNFLTERKVGGVDLSKVIVVAATNIGNYTYEPDNNILSRFCMFYVVNTTFDKYLSKKYKTQIYNHYTDEEEREGVIFEPRSLKPRCQEMLCMLPDASLLNDFYEGYTNQSYMPIFSTNNKLNEIVSSFAITDDKGNWHIPNDDVDRLAAVLYQRIACTSRRKNLVEYFTNYNNIRYDVCALQTALKRCINS